MRWGSGNGKEEERRGHRERKRSNGRETETERIGKGKEREGIWGREGVRGDIGREGHAEVSKLENVGWEC